MGESTIRDGESGAIEFSIHVEGEESGWEALEGRKRMKREATTALSAGKFQNAI